MTDMLEMERAGNVVRLTMNRPEIGNALNGEMAGSIAAALRQLEDDAELRAVVLTGAGRVFSAGADLNAMKSMKDASVEENVRDAKQAARAFGALFEFPRPVIARVNGPARGGGVGLIAACDFAVGVPKAHFAFTEVRLGIVPAMISPYVVRKLGAAVTRRLFLTGESFDAEHARRIGLLDEVNEDLDGAVWALTEKLRSCAPGALGAVKRLLRMIEIEDPAVLEQRTAELIAELRVGDEAQEGMAAFLEKRRPRWAGE